MPIKKKKSLYYHVQYQKQVEKRTSSSIQNESTFYHDADNNTSSNNVNKESRGRRIVIPSSPLTSTTVTTSVVSPDSSLSSPEKARKVAQFYNTNNNALQAQPRNRRSRIRSYKDIGVTINGGTNKLLLSPTATTSSSSQSADHYAYHGHRMDGRIYFSSGNDGSARESLSLSQKRVDECSRYYTTPACNRNDAEGKYHVRDRPSTTISPCNNSTPATISPSNYNEIAHSTSIAPPAKHRSNTYHLPIVPETNTPTFHKSNTRRKDFIFHPYNNNDIILQNNSYNDGNSTISSLSTTKSKKSMVQERIQNIEPPPPPHKPLETTSSLSSVKDRIQQMEYPKSTNTKSEKKIKSPLKEQVDFFEKHSQKKKKAKQPSRKISNVMTQFEPQNTTNATRIASEFVSSRKNTSKKLLLSKKQQTFVHSKTIKEDNDWIAFGDTSCNYFNTAFTTPTTIHREDAATTMNKQVDTRIPPPPLPKEQPREINTTAPTSNNIQFQSKYLNAALHALQQQHHDVDHTSKIIHTNTPADLYVSSSSVSSIEQEDDGREKNISSKIQLFEAQSYHNNSSNTPSSREEQRDSTTTIRNNNGESQTNADINLNQYAPSKQHTPILYEFTNEDEEDDDDTATTLSYSSVSSVTLSTAFKTNLPKKNNTPYKPPVKPIKFRRTSQSSSSSNDDEEDYDNEKYIDEDDCHLGLFECGAQPQQSPTKQSPLQCSPTKQLSPLQLNSIIEVNEDGSHANVEAQLSKSAQKNIANRRGRAATVTPSPSAKSNPGTSALERKDSTFLALNRYVNQTACICTTNSEPRKSLFDDSSAITDPSILVAVPPTPASGGVSLSSYSIQYEKKQDRKRELQEIQNLQRDQKEGKELQSHPLKKSVVPTTTTTTTKDSIKAMGYNRRDVYDSNVATATALLLNETNPTQLIHTTTSPTNVSIDTQQIETSCPNQCLAESSNKVKQILQSFGFQHKHTKSNIANPMDTCVGSTHVPLRTKDDFLQKIREDTVQTREIQQGGKRDLFKEDRNGHLDTTWEDFSTPDVPAADYFDIYSFDRNTNNTIPNRNKDATIFPTDGTNATKKSLNTTSTSYQQFLHSSHDTNATTTNPKSLKMHLPSSVILSKTPLKPPAYSQPHTQSNQINARPRLSSKHNRVPVKVTNAFSNQTTNDTKQNRNRLPDVVTNAFEHMDDSAIFCNTAAANPCHTDVTNTCTTTRTKTTKKNWKQRFPSTKMKQNRMEDEGKNGAFWKHMRHKKKS